jgi:nucleotide-binding universal stress UspA family protein
MKRSILIPTDFSDNAWSAIVYALKLYADEFCTFYFLNSTNLKNENSRTYITTHYIDVLDKNSKKELKELKDQIDNVNANANHIFKTISSPEPLLKAIEMAVKKHKIDLVIMGTKGVSGLNKFFFGSNTVKIIKNLKACPTLTIPDGFEFVKPKQIAFPTDFNRFYDYAELKPLMDFADLFNSKIKILHINVEKKLSDLQEYNMTMLKEHLKNHEYSFHWMPEYTKKTKEIEVFIEDLKIDVLVMLNYKHSIIETIIKEPVIQKIGYSPSIPFLVIPD